MREEYDDIELEEELRRVAARVEPIPGWLLEAAVGAFTWRSIDAELAELVFDSLADQDEAALVRSGQQGRLLSFQASDLTIEIEVTGSGASRKLIGQLLPPRPASVDIRSGKDVVRLEADDLGRFSAGSLQSGPISLRCSPAPGTARSGVVTDWISI